MKFTAIMFWLTLIHVVLRLISHEWMTALAWFAAACWIGALWIEQRATEDLRAEIEEMHTAGFRYTR